MGVRRVRGGAAGHRGLGVGRELVRFAERKCGRDGLVSMQLELLVPRNWSHPVKEFLAAWYTHLSTAGED